MAKDDFFSKSASEILGYHFIIFQSTYTGYVRCYIDGNENYTFFTEDDFIKLFQKVNSPFELVYKARNCIETTSVFIWDVDNYKIENLKLKPEVHSIAEDIAKMNPLKNDKLRRRF